MNSHSAVPNSDEYIPPNTVYVPTTTYNSGPIVDFSFIRTKFGLLKILQQVIFFQNKPNLLIYFKNSQV